MRRLGYLSALLAALLALSACSLPRGAPVKSEILTLDEADDAAQNIAVEEVSRANVKRFNSWKSIGWHGHFHWPETSRGPAYNLIKAGDAIDLTLWDSSDNSLLTTELERSTRIGNLEVSPAGTIYVPYAEHVTVAGLSESQARELIQTKVSAVAPSVQVQLSVREGVNNTVYLVSGVAKPGPVALPNRNHTILSVLSQGGGISASVKSPVVKLIRNGRTYTIPATVLFSDARRNITVRGGDQIIVEQDKRHFTGVGSVQREQIIYFEREDITAMEALTMMGGLTADRANPQGVLVLREFDNKHVRSDGKGPSNEYVIFVVNLSTADGLFGASKLLIQPGDVVVATESALKPAQAIIALITSGVVIANAF